MLSPIKVIKEHLENLYMIGRLARYETKAQYSTHILGVLWELLNPLFQIATYWFVFGLGLRGGRPVDGQIDYLPWLVAGLALWFFISKSIVQGGNSIYARINLISQMNFPISIIPSFVIVTFLTEHMFMLVIVGFIMVSYDIPFTIHLIQLPYYLFATFCFSYSVALLFSTFSSIARDFQTLLQSAIRMLLYLSPILWSINSMPEYLQPFLKLNPLTYLINGYRDSLFFETWFWEHPQLTIYFWTFTLSIYFIASILHVKFRDSFADYL